MPRNKRLTKHPKKKLPQDRWKRLAQISATVGPIFLFMNQTLDLVTSVRDLF